MIVARAGEYTLKIPGHKAIWQVPGKYHVSILTLCLSEQEVYRLAGGEGQSNDHGSCLPAILATLAEAAACRSWKGEAIQQLLDGKYSVSLNRFASAGTDDEIRRLWTSLLRGGEFRGAYWAIMTHGRASAELVEEVDQQLKTYSLQHCCMLVQQKNRCRELQRQIQALDVTLAENEQQHRRAICLFCRQIAGLKSELRLAEHNANRLQRHLELFRFRQKAQCCI